MALQTEKRPRAYVPRSRNGCATCRRRKIKCGEEWPGCQRCKYSGWTCPGYESKRASQSSKDVSEGSISSQSALAISQEGKGLTRKSYPDSDCSPKPSCINNNPFPRESLAGQLHVSRYALPFKIPGSKEERQALHYFNVFAAANMSGVVPNDFWSRTILQRCQEAAPLRHATAALGALYVEYSLGPRDLDDDQSFCPSDAAMQAYGRAVRSLRGYIDSNPSPSHDLILMCSAVFFCFELLRGDREAASKHVESGLRIMRSQHSNGKKNSAIGPFTNVNEELLAMFARMDLEATLLDDSRIPILRLPSSGQADHKGTTMAELDRTLVVLLHTAFVFLVQSIPWKETSLYQVPSTILEERKELLERFEAWESATDSFEQTINAASDETEPDVYYRKALATLRLHSGIVDFVVRHQVCDEIQAAAPSLDDDAPRLLALAEIALLSETTDTRATPVRRRFTPHTGIVLPLYILAIKVRDGSIRRRALELLKQCQCHREGFFDGLNMVYSVSSLARRAAGMGLGPNDVPLEYMTIDGEYVGWTAVIGSEPRELVPKSEKIEVLRMFNGRTALHS